jgi:hypothetical protein
MGTTALPLVALEEIQTAEAKRQPPAREPSWALRPDERHRSMATPPGSAVRPLFATSSASGVPLLAKNLLRSVPAPYRKGGRRCAPSP